MIVQLEILDKKKVKMEVNAYKITDYSRECIGKFSGTIQEIKDEIESQNECICEIEKSIFDGWY